MSWRAIRGVPRDAIVDARIQLHHAAQVVASAGLTFLEPQPDDSHPNFGWVNNLCALVGRPLQGAGAQIALRVSDLSLLLLTGNGHVDEEFGLERRNLEDGYGWLASVTARFGTTLPTSGLSRSPYEIQNHAVKLGAPFTVAHSEAFTQLARWFANGSEMLTESLTSVSGASDVRCWPHHFDLGALVVVETEPDGSLGKSIGIGLSPGDEQYAEPYWYVSPWPYPDPDALPPLEGGGRWHTHGYTAAILTATEMFEGPADQQSDCVREFLAGAIDSSQRILAR